MNGENTGCEAEWTPLRLYLGGIPLQCQEPELRQYFEKFGRVLCVGVNRNREGHPRGCGYVVFDSDSLKVDQACIIGQQHEIMGKQIEVKLFVECEKERQRLLQEDCEKALHISGLPLEATEKDVDDYFSKFGKIERAYIICKDGKSRGFGFIKFVCPRIKDKVIGREHMILGKKITVNRKIAKNDMKKDSTKSGGSKSHPQSTSGKGSWGEVSQVMDNTRNSPYANNQPQPYPPMNYGSQSQVVMINGMVYAPVGMNTPAYGMPAPMPYPNYGIPAMGGCYMVPPMQPVIGYGVPCMNPNMHQMGMANGWTQPATYGNPMAQPNPQKPTFKKPLQPGSRFGYQHDGANKAVSTCGSMPTKTGPVAEFDETYSTVSKQVCFSAKGEQGTSSLAKEEKKEDCIFSRMRKQYWPSEKKYDFNPCDKILASFAEKPSASPQRFKEKLGGCNMVKPKGDLNDDCTEQQDKAIRDLFSDAES